MSFSAIRLTQGTKEYVIAEVTDETDQVTTLVGTTPKFDVKVVDTDLAEAAGFVKQSAVNCSVTDMILSALVDTTGGSGITPWPLGRYAIFFYWVIGSETPREGPFDIYVV
jgi:hypothetical protein